MSARPSGDAQRVASYGRGGAGNIGREDPNAHTHTADLVTPTLKSDRYTTGRGGSGNMASNDPNHPEIARASQDVDAPTHREPVGPQHFGRGGAANILKTTGEAENNQRKSDEPRRESFGAEAKGLVDKGKGLLKGLGKK